MNSYRIFFLFALAVVLFLPGCDLIKGIFQAGFWTAIILIVIVIALIVWAFYKLSGRGSKNPRGG